LSRRLALLYTITLDRYGSRLWHRLFFRQKIFFSFFFCDLSAFDHRRFPVLSDIRIADDRSGWVLRRFTLCSACPRPLVTTSSSSSLLSVYIQQQHADIHQQRTFSAFPVDMVDEGGRHGGLGPWFLVFVFLERLMHPCMSWVSLSISTWLSDPDKYTRRAFSTSFFLLSLSAQWWGNLVSRWIWTTDDEESNSWPGWICFLGFGSRMATAGAGIGGGFGVDGETYPFVVRGLPLG